MMLPNASGRRGLTLVELLIAMSIFSLLGLFLFTLVGRAIEIYHSAEGTGTFIDSVDQTVSPLVDDLSCVYIGDPGGSGPKVEMLMTRDRKFVPSLEAPKGGPEAPLYAPGDPRAFVLRFVRSFAGGELETTIGRFAGTTAGGAAYIDGIDDLAESRAPDGTSAEKVSRARSQGAGAQPADNPRPSLLPPGGLMEVMYFCERAPGDAPGVCTLYRAVRSPIGGPGSFFAPDALDRMTPEWIAAHALPVVSNIAYFGVLFWGQTTTDWRAEEALDGLGELGPKSDWAGGHAIWDSTRGRLSAFGLGRGEASLKVYDDDVFPARAQLVVTLADDGGAQGLTAGETSANSKFVRVTNPKAFAASAGGATFVKVGAEWMETIAVDGAQVTVKRGMRRTEPTTHPSGTEYLVGRSFVRSIEIPANRSWFRGPGEAR